MQLPEIQQQTPKKRHKSKWRYLIYALIVIGIILISFTVRANSSDDESFWRYLIETPARILAPALGIDSISDIIASDEQKLTGVDEDRINILLLGVGGRGHDGSLLTDTIIIASYKPSTNEASMLSIPRDLSIPIPGYGWRKINNLYALAEYNDPGTGGDYSKQIISQIFDVQIPYYIRIDFQGFEEAVDLLGGIDVEVPRTLSDYQYPIPGREDYEDPDQRYEHLYIEEGQQHFDGETALKYVRSRHAGGIEGSDFARAERQQLVLKALLNKVFSFSTLLRPGKINKMYANIDEHVDTNLSFEEMVAFAKLAKEFNQEEKSINTVVLDNSINGPLQAANYNGAFVLEPKVEDFSELKFIAANIFSPDLSFERPTEEDSALPHITLEHSVQAKDNARIEVQNGTFVNGLARANQEQLEELGFNVIKVGNAENQDYTKTIIYDFSDGDYPDTLNFLAGNYTDNITDQIPGDIRTEADFLIILGLDNAY